MPAPEAHRSTTRVRIGVGLNLFVAALHLVDVRTRLSPDLRGLHASYFSDIAIPFAFYYLLCFVDDRVPVLRSTTAKAFAVFVAATSAELLQGIGIPALGHTFDPWDIAMYAAGVSLAALLDALVLSRLVPAWPLAGLGPRRTDSASAP